MEEVIFNIVETSPVLALALYTLYLGHAANMRLLESNERLVETIRSCCENEQANEHNE
jgi:hypothetical protein